MASYLKASHGVQRQLPALALMRWYIDINRRATCAFTMSPSNDGGHAPAANHAQIFCLKLGYSVDNIRKPVTSYQWRVRGLVKGG